MDERPWSTLAKGKPLNAHRLSRLLKPYEVSPGGLMRDGALLFRGYRRAAFEEAWERYLPVEALQRHKPNESGPKPPETEALRDASVTLSKPADQADKHWVCDLVTLCERDTPDVPAEDDDGHRY
jgi:hypothetical protein